MITPNKSLFLHAIAGLMIAAGCPVLAQQARVLPVTLELGDVSLTKVPYLMAADYGIYERNGLAVDQFITPNAAELVRGSGIDVPAKYIRADAVGEMCICGASPTVVAMTTVATAPRRIILATNDPYSRFHLIVRSDIATPEDLKGKRIGYGSFGALDHYSLMLFFRKMGWDSAHDVSMFSKGNGPQSIVKGRVDAFAGMEPALAQAKQLGLHDLLDLSQYHFPMPGSSVEAMADWLPKNRETAARFMKATVEAIAMLKSDKKAAFASMTKWYGITDPARLEALYADAKYLPSKPYPSIEGLKTMQAIYPWREMEKQKPEDLVDSSFISDLDKSGFIDSLSKVNGVKAAASTGVKAGASAP